MSAVLVEFPSELIEQIDAIANGNHSKFLIELAERQVKLHRQRTALHAAAGSWKPEDYPEFANGSYPWVRSIRDSADRQE